jgi:hypothetical protein
MIRENSFIKPENPSVAGSASVGAGNLAPTGINPNEGDGAAPVGQADFFDDRAVQGRELNRNDLMQAFVTPTEDTDVVPVPDFMIQEQQRMHSEFVQNMTPEDAGNVLDNFASQASTQHFENEGVNPSDLQTALYEQKVKNDVMTLSAHKNGDAQPGMESQEVVGGRVKDYMLDATNHQVKQQAENGHASPLLTASTGAMTSERVMAAGDMLHNKKAE